MSDFIELRVVIPDINGVASNETLIIPKKDILKIQTRRNVPYISIRDHRGILEYGLLTKYEKIKKDLLDA